MDYPNSDNGFWDIPRTSAAHTWVASQTGDNNSTRSGDPRGRIAGASYEATPMQVEMARRDPQVFMRHDSEAASFEHQALATPGPQLPTSNTNSNTAGRRHGQRTIRSFPTLAPNTFYAASNGSHQPQDLLLTHGQDTYIEHGTPTVTRQKIGIVSRDERSRKLSYQCILCTVGRFGRQQELQRHFDHKHVNDSVQCSHPGCEELFPRVRRDYLRDHLRRAHGL